MIQVGAETFNQRWTTWYPAANPFGYELRDAYHSRWLRIHTLPSSKRYPETSAERAEVLARQNAVATDILGAGEKCMLVGYDYAGGSSLPANHPLHSLLRNARSPFMRVASDDPEAEPTSFFGAEVEWRVGRYDPVLIEIAEDRLAALWVAIDTGAVFAPYDGGVDLIYPSEWERDVARERFRMWLSDRPDGL